MELAPLVTLRLTVFSAVTGVQMPIETLSARAFPWKTPFALRWCIWQAICYLGGLGGRHKKPRKSAGGSIVPKLPSAILPKVLGSLWAHVSKKLQAEHMRPVRLSMGRGVANSYASLPACLGTCSTFQDKECVPARAAVTIHL